MHSNTVENFKLKVVSLWESNKIRIQGALVFTLKKNLKIISGKNTKSLIFAEALNFSFFHLRSDNSRDLPFSLQPDFGKAVSPIRTSGGLKTNPSTALSHCWADFFCSAYCQHARLAAVSCARLTLQEAVSKMYTEISELYSEQQLGRENFLACCVDPTVINSYKIFNKITIVWEIKYYNTTPNHVSLCCL